MRAQPRIITRTVLLLRTVANQLDKLPVIGGAATKRADRIAAKLRKHADKLDEQDARETRLEPSKRRKK